MSRKSSLILFFAAQLLAADVFAQYYYITPPRRRVVITQPIQVVVPPVVVRPPVRPPVVRPPVEVGFAKDCTVKISYVDDAVIYPIDDNYFFSANAKEARFTHFTGDYIAAVYSTRECGTRFSLSPQQGTLLRSNATNDGRIVDVWGLRDIYGRIPSRVTYDGSVSLRLQRSAL